MNETGLKKNFLQLFYYLISKGPVRRRMSNEKIKKLCNSLGINCFGNYDHYKDQYWNDLDLVQYYINENATGRRDTIWQEDILTRFKKFVPFNDVLIIGCGNGWVERQLHDLKIGLHFDAFDISEKYLDTAKSLAGDRNITYFKADINNLEDFVISKYDAIFNVGVLHHTFRLARAVWILSRALKPNGLLFNFDYVGPTRNQYSSQHLSILHDVNSQLPKRFQSRHPLRPAKENFLFGDPTEAVHSDLVRPTVERFFDIIYERDINGGVAYQILWNNVDEFKKKDSEANEALEFLLKNDAKYTHLKKVPVLFWYGVGTPKSLYKISGWETLSSVSIN